MRQRVIGQTGSIVLSDESIQRKQEKKRTVRYRYVKMGKNSYRAEVISPFHKDIYGACSFGTTRQSAKKALQRHLRNSYRYMGSLLFSDVDAANDIYRTVSRSRTLVGVAR